MKLKDLIEEYYKYGKNPNWGQIFQKNSSLLFFNSSKRLNEFLEKCNSNKNFSNQMHILLPIIFSCGNPDLALTQLLEFSKSFHKKNKNEFRWDHPKTKYLIYIFGRSNFLSNRLIRNPEISEKLLKSQFLYKNKSLVKMESELQIRIKKQKKNSIHILKNTIRRYKYQEYLRITVRDLAGLCTFKDTLEELSSIAICCLRMAFTQITLFELKKEGITFNKEISKKNKKSFEKIKNYKNKKLQIIFPFTIFGLGKLGGNELNYSSDIDLIFVHDNEIITGKEEQDNKIRLKVARILIDTMSDITEEGFLARIDMRLRPGGNSSPLVQSLDEIEIYYSSSKEIWERQALIKAVKISGNSKCELNFFKIITPFVYRSLLEQGVLKDVEKVKNRIEEEHLRESFLNVKLGVGGIREIEFFVQTFQLLYGGIKPKLRNPSTLEALNILDEFKLVPSRDLKTLNEAYLFLRNVEHHLQLREEHQTHTLPSEIILQSTIARNLGYNDHNIEIARQNFLNDLKNIMGSVRAIFSGLFSRKHLEIEAAIISSSHIKNFSNNEKQFIELFSQNLAPLINEKTKNKFQLLFESIGVKINIYKKLSKSPQLLSRLTRIAETSEMLWNYLLNHLDLIEELDYSKFEISSKTWSEKLKEKIDNCLGNEEEEIEQLRMFKHKITFLLGSGEMDGLLSYEETRNGLTMLAEIILKEAFQLSHRWMKKRYGLVKNYKGDLGKFAIIGLGKLGGCELTYFSDLDLIFIHSGDGTSDGCIKINSQEYWVKLIKRLISCLTTITINGYAYKLDTRLRPSGNAGVLVTPLNVYLKYHQTSLAWEHQALIKGRVISGIGGEKWFKKVQEGIRKAVYEWITPENIDSQINHLRIRKEKELSHENRHKKNIKEGKGGLLDIEYLTQSIQLKHGKKFQKLQCNKTIDALKIIGKLNLIKKEETVTLEYYYKFLRLIENGLRLIHDDSTNLINLEYDSSRTITQLLKNQGYLVSNLKDSLESANQNVRKIYLKYF